MIELVRPERAGLLSKHGMVVAELARALLDCKPGERVARVQEYAIRLDASVGTVQSALDYLQSAGAADLVARGRLGTYVRNLHYPLLWAFGQQRPLVGALPLPYSRRIEGLATGIRLQGTRQPMDVDLRFMRGATQRLEALAAHRCDWALVSRFAAEHAAVHGLLVDTVALLGPESYMAGHVLLVRAGVSGLLDGMRVGIDSHSTDHAYSVRSVCSGARVDLVEIEYHQALRLLASGEIDATVWNAEDIPADLVSLAVVQLNGSRDPNMALLAEAALVVRRANRASAHVVEALVDLAELRQVQLEVVSHQRRPAY